MAQGGRFALNGSFEFLSWADNIIQYVNMVRHGLCQLLKCVSAGPKKKAAAKKDSDASVSAELHKF